MRSRRFYSRFELSRRHLPSQVVNMPQLTLQSEGVEYTYDWVEWAKYTETDVIEEAN